MVRFFKNSIFFKSYATSKKSKHDTRSNCSFDFDDLCQRVENLLERGIPLSHVRKMEERCFRFMHGYQLKLGGPMLDYAMKQYSSHRMFPSSFVVERFEEEYKKHLENKIKAQVKLFDSR